jgi:hypothetical protein
VFASVNRRPARLRATRCVVVLLVLLGLSFGSAALESSGCAATIAELRNITGDASFPLRWEEGSMTDGKPLIVSITERDGSIFLAFVKSQEGLWAEGTALICKSSADLEARMTKGRIHLGPAAHWILRHSIGHGGTFLLSRLPTGELRIATPGWHGAFLPRQN